MQATGLLAAESACSPAANRQRGSSTRQHVGALCAGNSVIIVGLALGWSSAALAVSEGGQGFPITVEEWSWVSSIYTLSAAVGAPLIALSIDHLGRRVIILLVSPLSAVAWALHIWATQVWMLCVGRILLGLASSAIAIAVPIYVTEMSEPAIRGALSIYFEILLCLGILIIYVLGAWVPVVWMNVICLAHSVLHGVLFFRFPETARWYLIRNRREEARKSLEFFRGKEYDVDLELNTVQAALEGPVHQTTGLATFRTNAARKGLIVVTVLMTFEQITGVNAVTFYASKLFTDAGVFNPHISSVIVAFTRVIAAGVSMVYVDRHRRRDLLFNSAVVMVISTGCLGIYFYIKTEMDLDVSSFTWLPIVFVSIYMYGFSIGFGPVCWKLLGEIFPDNVKSASTAFATAVSWLCAFFVTKFYPGLSDSFGEHKCYWTFCVLCIVFPMFLYFVPETKGKSLDEIQAEMSNYKNNTESNGV